jgi:chromosome segregation ATPase
MNKILIELENIGIFRGRQAFELAKGLNVIYAPNASGKSSLIAGLKAASVMAFTPEELKRVLNDYENEGFVKLLVDDNEVIIQLRRRADGTVEAIGKTLSDNGIVRKVAFIDLENELVNAVYSGDEEHVKQILKEISGLNYLETIITIISGLKSEYEYRYQIKRREYESRKEEIEKEIKETEMNLEAIRKRQNEILSRPEIEPVRKEIENIRQKQKEIEEQLSIYRKKEIEVKNTIALRDIDLKKVETDLMFFVEKRNKLLEEIESIERNLIEYRREIEKLSLEIKHLETEKDTLSRELMEKEAILKRRKQIIEYDICPYCGAPIDRKLLETEIIELESQISELRDKINNILSEIERRQRRIDELKQSGEERLKNARKELSEISSKISELEQNKNKIENEITLLNRKLKDLENKIKQLEEERELLLKRLEIFEKKYPEASTLVDEYRRLQIQEHHLMERLDRLYGRLKQLEEMHKDVLFEQNNVEKTNLLEKYFRMRLSEIKSLAVNRVNEVILRHFKLLKLAELEFPILSSDFELRLTRRGGVPTTLAELSDAEKAIFVIAITYALKEYVAEEFPFYVVDTLIEFIDDTRAREVLSYLMESASDKNVIIVTKTKPYTGEPTLLTQNNILVNEIPIK